MLTYKGNFLRRLGRVAVGVFGIIGLTFLSLLAVEVLWPRNGPLPGPADAIVCLGGDMSYRGWDRPGPASARRARTCAELQLAGVAPVIVFTGYGNKKTSAARAMAQLAIDEGLPPDAVIVEPDARSTIQNAAFALSRLPEDTGRIVVVSDAFHLPRSWLVFKILGAPETGLFAARPAYTTEDSPKVRTHLDWVLRESVVIWTNVGRMLAYGAGGLAGIDRETRIAWFN